MVCLELPESNQINELPALPPVSSRFSKALVSAFSDLKTRLLTLTSKPPTISACVHQAEHPDQLVCWTVVQVRTAVGWVSAPTLAAPCCQANRRGSSNHQAPPQKQRLSCVKDALCKGGANPRDINPKATELWCGLHARSRVQRLRTICAPTVAASRPLRAAIP